MRRLRLRILFLAVLAGLITAVPASAITGGQPDNGAHPYVGLMYGGSTAASFKPRCTGFLVAPRVYVTAAHCAPDGVAVAISFSQTAPQPQPPNGFFDQSDPSFIGGTFHRQPGFCEGCGNGLPGFHTNDLAVVALEADGPAADYPDLPALDATASLDSNTALGIVGYGARDDAGTPFQRYRASTTLVKNSSVYYSNGFLRLHANKSGICFGDSGGPNLVGGTVVGVNSFVPNGNNCNGVSYSTRLDTQAALDFVASFLP